MSRQFFLGGMDLEMVTIACVLQAFSELKGNEPVRVWNRQLAWGATMMDYHEPIAAAIRSGDQVIGVELDWDLDTSLGINPTFFLDLQAVATKPPVVLIDHHGAFAGTSVPTSLEQTLQMLKISLDDPLLEACGGRRWLQLVSANDRGHVAAMKALKLDPPSTPDEWRAIRDADRRAQEISEAEEQQAIQAIASNSRTLHNGETWVVNLPHSRTAAVADRLIPDLGGPGFTTLIVCSASAVNVFAPGATILELANEISGGYYGGDLPDRGFWGKSGLTADKVNAVRDLAVVKASTLWAEPPEVLPAPHSY